MINLSITQILDIWDELRDCLENKNKYGGNEAEIYAYCLTKCHCPLQHKGEYPEETEYQIATSLTNILRLFCTKYDCKAIVSCSGTSFPGTYCLTKTNNEKVPPFSHRAHIVIRK